MSPDPLGRDIQNPQSLNRYTYVLNNPETFIDPLGMWVCGSWTIMDNNTGDSWAGPEICAPATYLPRGVAGSSQGGGAYLLEWGWNGQAYMPNAYEYSFALKFAVKLILAKLLASRNAGQPPQTHPPQDQNGWWPPAPREGTYGEWLACEANDVLSHPDKIEAIGFGYGAALIFAGSGQEKKAWASLAFTGLVEIGSAVRTNMECQQEVNYHPSW